MGVNYFYQTLGQNGPRQTEIAKLDVAVGVDEDVGGFQIPVDHLMRVEVLHRAEHVVSDDLDVFLVEADFTFVIDQLFYVGPEMFFDEEQVLK